MTNTTASSIPVRWTLGVALWCAIGAASVAEGAGVAMVTDLRGKASTSSAGDALNLTILAELEAGTKVQLDAGSTLVALYLDGGDEYAFRGPATVVFGVTKPDVLNGEKPEKHGSPLGSAGKGVRIKPVGMAQAAIVMRGSPTNARIRLLNLHQTKTLETQPEFRWQPLQPGIKYGFKLSDDTGAAVFETEVAGTSFRLPANIRLKDGVPYTWEISARLPDGKKYATSADFVVALANVRAQAERLRPADTAPVSTRIAYAAWLDQADLADEARKYWQSAAAERPEDPRLKRLAQR